MTIQICPPSLIDIGLKACAYSHISFSPQIRVYQPSSPISIIQEQVLYPLSEDFQTLEAGNYTVLVTVFNAQLNESGMSARTYFVVGGETQKQLLDYPFVYIIVPGIVFVVIIIVINVIIFKRLHETRRKSVAYCKGNIV